MGLRYLLKIRSMFFLIVVFFSSCVYAFAINEITKTTHDLTWPLIFNGVVPTAVLGYIGRRYIAKQDAFHKIFFETKEDHEKRIGDIETTHKIRGCDQPVDHIKMQFK